MYVRQLSIVPPGLFTSFDGFIPPAMNRWAIVVSPYGTKNRGHFQIARDFWGELGR